MKLHCNICGAECDSSRVPIEHGKMSLGIVGYKKAKPEICKGRFVEGDKNDKDID